MATIARRLLHLLPAAALSLLAGCASADSDDGRAEAEQTASVCAAPPTSGDPLVVRTSLGNVRGKKDGKTRSFRGLPFAKPPVGDLRFRAPEPPDCFGNETYDATKYRSSCVQRPAIGGPKGNEDCLYLNVWTPAKSPGERLPVLFYIHGGAEIAGSSSQTGLMGVMDNIFDGDEWAARSNAIIVTTNYRLGPLGFLAHPSLRRESGGASGNVGLLDLIDALKWVRTNAEAFGGDPSKVMVFGQSAGALNACALFTSPLAKGLFSSLLMQSGACIAAPREVREEDGRSFAAEHGCPGDESDDALRCLRSLGPDALAPKPLEETSLDNPRNNDPARHPWWLGWGPTVDGVVLEDVPLAVIRRGGHTHVPFAIGTNSSEAAYYVPPGVATCGKLRDVLARRFGPTTADRIVSRYDCSWFGRPEAVEAFTDLLFTCPARRIARTVVEAQAEPVYRYLYTHEAPGIRVLGAYHSAELPFLFGTFEFFGIDLSFGKREEMTRNMQRWWVGLADKGDPNSRPGFAWPRYDVARDEILVIDRNPSTRTRHQADECDLWDEIERDTPGAGL